MIRGVARVSSNPSRNEVKTVQYNRKAKPSSSKPSDEEEWARYEAQRSRLPILPRQKLFFERINNSNKILRIQGSPANQAPVDIGLGK